MGNYDINVNLNFADAVNTQSLNASIDKITDAINQFKNAINSKRGTSGGGSSTNAFTQYAKDAEDAARRIQLVRTGLVNAQKELVKAMSLPNNGVEATKWLNQVEALKKELTKLTEQQNNLSKVNPFANYAKTTEEAKLRIKQLYEYINDIKNSINANAGDKTFIATAEQQIKQAQVEIRKLKTQLTEFQSISGKQQSGTIFVRYSRDANEAGIRIAKAKQLIAELQAQASKLQNKGLLSNQEQQRLNDMPNRISRVQGAVRQLQSQQRNYNAILDQTNVKGTSAFNNLFKGAFSLRSAFGAMAGVMGIGGGFYALFQGIKEAIKFIADFDLAQAKLRSILGETRKGMEDVSLSAIEIGRSSIFGAKGVTELQIELAKMGFTKQEIMDMQQAIVNLATATQEDLASSSEVVANVLRAFQMNASNATRVVDIMGKAFNDSALDLANFREAIKYVAPVAHQANFTFEQTVSLLEALSNAGIKGSLAGTGLTNIISRLGNENSKFVKTLGHTVDGFDGFIEAMIEFKRRGIDLTDVFQLVDRRAAATFSILLQGVDTVEQFNQKLKESGGVMAKQAAVQLDTITNKTLLLKNAWEAFILSVDSGNGTFSRTIKDMIQGVTDLLNVTSILGDKENEIKRETEKFKVNRLEDIIKRSTYSPQTKVQMWMDIEWTQKYYAELDKIVKEGNKKVSKLKMPGQLFDNALQISVKNNIKAQVDELYAKYKGAIERTKGLETKLIEDLSDEQLQIFKDRVKLGENVVKVYDDMVTNGMQQYQQLIPQATSARKIVDESINKIEAEYKKLVDIKPLEVGDAKKALELQKQYMELRKQLELEWIKQREDDFIKEKDLLEKERDLQIELNNQTIADAKLRNLQNEVVNNKFATDYGVLLQKRAKDEIENEKQLLIDLIKIKLSGNEQKIAIAWAEYNATIKIAETQKAKLEDIYQTPEYLKLTEKALSDLMQSEADAIINEAEDEYKKIIDGLNKIIIEIKPEVKGLNGEAIQKQETITYDIEVVDEQATKDLEKFIATYKKYSDWAAANPLMDALMGDKVQKDIFSGILDEKKLSGLTQLWTKSLSTIGDSIRGVADAWVSATEKILSNYDKLISETQNQLQIELQLNQQGFASNVTFEQKKLENLKEARKEAAEDYKKAQQAQMAIDAAATVASLSLAWAKYIKTYADYPFVGVALAISSIAAAFGVFQKFQASAKEASTRYEKGGMLTGKRHSQGGIKIKELNAEVEGGEYVINRKSTIKYRPLIEAINKDDKVFLNKVYLNGLTKSAVKVNVNLDESKYLKGMYDLMMRGNTMVEFRGNYRIERTGNVERRIRLN